MSKNADALRCAESLERCDCIDFDGDFGASACHIRRLVAENEAQAAKVAEGKRLLIDQMDRTVEAQRECLALRSEVKAQAALLRQAVEEMTQAHNDSFDGREFRARQTLMDAITEIRQHLEGKA